MTPLKYLLGIIIIICLIIVFFTFINRGTLCELTIKSGQHEVAAKLACTAGYFSGRGFPPGLWLVEP